MLSRVFKAVRHQRVCTLPCLFSSAANNGPIVRFKDVSFSHSGSPNQLLDQVDFFITKGSKVTIMGQNGSGKSTIIKLIGNVLRPEEGQVIVRPGEKVATVMQTMPTNCRDLTVMDFFAEQLTVKDLAPLARHEIEAKMGKALNSVLLDAPGDRIIKSFSGGQQARLLLAAALIHNPTLLLLDEPTNNLDADGLWHLQSLITETEQTCVVVSHDEDFLNSFTDQVLYLDIFSKKIETYQGDYFFVKNEITKRIKRENAENARRKKDSQAKKDQANKFAKKGGGLRKVAKTMRQVAADIDEGLVDVRKEDVTLREFTIPFTHASPTGKFLTIAQVSGFERVAPLQSGPIDLRKGSRVQVCGPNGSGKVCSLRELGVGCLLLFVLCGTCDSPFVIFKTTFLERIAAGTAPGVTIEEGVSIGYYRQDFHNFDFDSTVVTCLEEASNRKHTREELYKIAASFLLRGKTVMTQQVKTLSEGQKGLLSLACLSLQEPSILIMDEPTNHINFRHLPALAKAVRSFQGAVLVVSHDHHFVDAVGVDSIIDMGKELMMGEEPKKMTA
jgi:ATPase subunit of ABC transporter with duplicated ATPase domains